MVSPDDPNQPPLTPWSPRRKSRKSDPGSWASKPAGSEKIWAGVARKFVPEPGRPPTPRVMIQRMFGKGARGHGLKTKDAAQALGVSQSTVQRWIRDRKLPDSVAAGALRQQYQGWQGSPSGRKSGLGRKALADLKGVTRVKFTGQLKISFDVRYREDMDVEISDPDAWARVVDLMASGDDRGAHDAFEDLVRDSANWGAPVYLKIDDIGFD